MEGKVLFESSYLNYKNNKILYIVSIIICIAFLSLLGYFEALTIINFPELFFIPMMPAILLIVRLLLTIRCYRRKIIIKENSIFVRNPFGKGCRYNYNINDYSVLITKNSILNFMDKENNLLFKCVIGYYAVEELRKIKEIKIIENDKIESYLSDDLEIKYMNNNNDNTALLLKLKYKNELCFNIENAKSVSYYYEPIGIFNIEIVLENEIIEISFFQIHISWEIKDKNYNLLLEDCRTIGKMSFEEMNLLINRVINKEELEYVKYYPFEF